MEESAQARTLSKSLGIRRSDAAVSGHCCTPIAVVFRTLGVYTIRAFAEGAVLAERTITMD